MWTFRSTVTKEVPYSRLVDTSPSNLPTKLDSDSNLHSDKSKLSVLETGELQPKNSVSDSKLAVDYFTTSSDVKSEVSSIKSDILNLKSPISGRNAPFPEATTPQMSASFNASESHHSLGGLISNEEKLLKEVS